MLSRSSASNSLSLAALEAEGDGGPSSTAMAEEEGKHSHSETASLVTSCSTAATLPASSVAVVSSPDSSSLTGYGPLSAPPLRPGFTRQQSASSTMSNSSARLRQQLHHNHHQQHSSHTPSGSLSSLPSPRDSISSGVGGGAGGGGAGAGPASIASSASSGKTVGAASSTATAAAGKPGHTSMPSPASTLLFDGSAHHAVARQQEQRERSTANLINASIISSPTSQMTGGYRSSTRPPSKRTSSYNSPIAGLVSSSVPVTVPASLARQRPLSISPPLAIPSPLPSPPLLDSLNLHSSAGVLPPPAPLPLSHEELALHNRSTQSVGPPLQQQRHRSHAFAAIQSRYHPSSLRTEWRNEALESPLLSPEADGSSGGVSPGGTRRAIAIPGLGSSPPPMVDLSMLRTRSSEGGTGQSAARRGSGDAAVAGFLPSPDPSTASSFASTSAHHLMPLHAHPHPHRTSYQGPLHYNGSVYSDVSQHLPIAPAATSAAFRGSISPPRARDYAFGLKAASAGGPASVSLKGKEREVDRNRSRNPSSSSYLSGGGHPHPGDGPYDQANVSMDLLSNATNDVDTATDVGTDLASDAGGSAVRETDKLYSAKDKTGRKTINQWVPPSLENTFRTPS